MVLTKCSCKPNARSIDRDPDGYYRCVDCGGLTTKIFECAMCEDDATWPNLMWPHDYNFNYCKSCQKIYNLPPVEY